MPPPCPEELVQGWVPLKILLNSYFLFRWSNSSTTQPRSTTREFWRWFVHLLLFLFWKKDLPVRRLTRAFLSIVSILSFLQGESSGNLFPRPVYEEPPQEQRSNMLRCIKLLFVEVANDFVTWLPCKVNISRSRRKMVARNISDLSLMDQTDDAFNFAALCRGEEMRAQA